MLGIRHDEAGAAPNYRTLSEPNAAVTRAMIRLVADAVMPVGQLQTLFAPLHLQIVGGPGEDDVHSLARTATHVGVAAQLSA